jgi:hypothetical protein
MNFQTQEQEMANQNVCPHLKFYPEDSKKHLSEACQAHRWLHEIANEDITSMAQLGHQDYYVHEHAFVMAPAVCLFAGSLLVKS